MITGETQWVRNAIATFKEPPFATVPVADSVALAAKILEIAENPRMRTALARAGRKFYQTSLSNEVAHKQLATALRALTA